VGKGARILQVVALFAAYALAFSAGRAAAAPPPTFADDCTTAFDPATCERIDYIAAVAAANAETESNLQAVWVGVWTIGGLTFGLWLFRPLAREMNAWGGGM
jgi:hypothetical protein